MNKRMKEYNPSEIEARKKMYKHIGEALKCVNKLDADGAGFHLYLARSVIDGEEDLGFVDELRRVSITNLGSKGVAYLGQEVNEMKEHIREKGSANLMLEFYIQECGRRFDQRNNQRELLKFEAIKAAYDCNVKSMHKYIAQLMDYKPLTAEENDEIRKILLEAINAKREKERDNAKDQTQIIDSSGIALAGAD